MDINKHRFYLVQILKDIYQDIELANSLGFKGGTALMLLFSSTKRLSIDIDIVVPDKEVKFNNILNKICKEYGFTRFEKQKRKARNQIDKVHYKLFFKSVIEEKESYVLLDILKEDNLW